MNRKIVLKAASMELKRDDPLNRFRSLFEDSLQLVSSPNGVDDIKKEYSSFCLGLDCEID
jgi:hypothetical protein